MSVLLSNMIQDTESFKIDSSLMCKPQFAAKSAFSDLSQTKDQIRTLTRPQISTFDNAVFKNKFTEIIAEPIKLSEFKDLNPCHYKPLSTFYSPKSFSDLQSIVKNSDKIGTALFDLSYDFVAKSFTSRFNLQIPPGNCPEPYRYNDGWAKKIIGCLSLAKPDTFYCCPRPLMFKNFTYFGFKALCEGEPTHSVTTEKLGAKKLALYLGLKLVKSTLPAALNQAMKLRSLLFKPKVQSRRIVSPTESAPTPAPRKNKRRCLPVDVNIFHEPPKFNNISLVRPQDYGKFEENVDMLTEYIGYLEIANKRLQENPNLDHLSLMDNNITAYEWFTSMFSKNAIAYTIPTAFMTICSLIVCTCIYFRVKVLRLNMESKRKQNLSLNSNQPKSSLVGYLTSYWNSRSDRPAQQREGIPPVEITRPAPDKPLRPPPNVQYAQIHRKD